MKNLILLGLFIPFASSGQKFEVSEMGGYSTNFSIVYGYDGSGFSNQLSFNYRLAKHFSIGAFYELNLWHPSDRGPNNYSYGIIPEFRSKHFYFGVNAAGLFVNNEHYPTIRWGTNYSSTTVKYMPAFLYGIHTGLNQKISKHIFLKEQVGYNNTFLKREVSNVVSNMQGHSTYTNNYYSQQFVYIYILAGVSYRL